MAQPEPVDPVKLVVAVLYVDTGVLEEALENLRGIWGETDFVGEPHDFDVTPYYAEEMGARLQRKLLSFKTLLAPGVLVEAKLQCNGIEDALAIPQGRRVNLDVGYLDHHKLVLASVKAAGQKVYLGSGVYADLMLRYHNGRLCPFEWTFPDFRDGRYDGELLEIRTQYLDQLRESANSRSES